MAPSCKQRLFVAYYLGESRGNATDAARKAGYRSPHEQGRQLLRKTTIRDLIEAKLAQVAMPQEEVLARLSDIAASSLEDFLEIGEGGHWVNLCRGKKLQRLHTLKKVKTKSRTFTRKGDDEPTTEVETEIEVKDSLPALVKLGEFYGLFGGGPTLGSIGRRPPRDDDGNPIEP